LFAMETVLSAEAARLLLPSSTIAIQTSKLQ
jgi:hypothetical protein